MENRPVVQQVHSPQVAPQLEARLPREAPSHQLGPFQLAVAPLRPVPSLLRPHQLPFLFLAAGVLRPGHMPCCRRRQRHPQDRQSAPSVHGAATPPLPASASVHQTVDRPYECPLYRARTPQVVRADRSRRGPDCYVCLNHRIPKPPFWEVDRIYWSDNKKTLAQNVRKSVSGLVNSISRPCVRTSSGTSNHSIRENPPAPMHHCRKREVGPTRMPDPESKQDAEVGKSLTRITVCKSPKR